MIGMPQHLHFFFCCCSHFYFWPTPVTFSLLVTWGLFPVMFRVVMGSEPRHAHSLWAIPLLHPFCVLRFLIVLLATPSSAWRIYLTLSSVLTPSHVCSARSNLRLWHAKFIYLNPLNHIPGPFGPYFFLQYSVNSQLVRHFLSFIILC